MRIIEINDQEVVALSYEEEQDFARSVMDTMADRRIWGDFQTLLDRIYYLKCTRGYQITTEEFLSFLNFAERYDTPTPDVVDGASTIRDIIHTDNPSLTHEEKAEESRRMTILAWQEVWQSHEGVKKVADGYKRFPEDKAYFDDDTPTDAYLEEQDRIEEEFWAEVEKIMKEMNYECSRHDAYTMASDYMMRGDYSLS